MDLEAHISLHVNWLNSFHFFRGNIQVLGVQMLLMIVVYKNNGGVTQNTLALFFFFLFFLLLEKYTIEYFVATTFPQMQL